MPRNFNQLSRRVRLGSGIGSYLQAAAAILVVLNLIAIYLLLVPPGGSKGQLTAESQDLQARIAVARNRASRLRQVTSKVQLGGSQADGFQTQYILSRRTAYQRLVGELQRLVKVSGMGERDAVYSEEPIEGTADLTLLSSAANYEGSYEQLRKFLVELDHSPVLIMLENLQAAPQQKGSQISASMRFQTIFQDEPVAVAVNERSAP